MSGTIEKSIKTEAASEDDRFKETREKLKEIINSQITKDKPQTRVDGAQTSDWLLPGLKNTNDNTITTGPSFTIINQNQLALQTNKHFDPHHLELLEARRFWTWERYVRFEVESLHEQPLLIRNFIMTVNVAESKLRDVRDLKSKKCYKMAVKRYMLCPDLSNMFGETSRQTANISNYHEALLNRIDARSIQQIDRLPEMKKQIFLALNYYVKCRDKMDRAITREQMNINKSSWVGFFTPTPKPTLFMGGQQNMYGNQYGGMGYGNQMPNNYQMQMQNYNNPMMMSQNFQQNQYNQRAMSPSANNFYNQNMNYANTMNMNNRIPEKAPSAANQKAKKAKESLQDFHSIMEKYVTENYEVQRSALLSQAKAYIEYHTRCLEIWSNIYKNVNEVDPSNCCNNLIKSLGVYELLEETENKIKMTDSHYNDQAQYQTHTGFGHGHGDHMGGNPMISHPMQPMQQSTVNNQFGQGNFGQMSGNYGNTSMSQMRPMSGMTSENVQRF
jgi:hypothetical protein